MGIKKCGNDEELSTVEEVLKKWGNNSDRWRRKKESQAAFSQPFSSPFYHKSFSCNHTQKNALHKTD